MQRLKKGKLAKDIRKNLKKQPAQVVCIGTDRATGDCLGPLVGLFLKNKGVSFPVYGDIYNPVHALNLKEILKDLPQDDRKTIAIDASLGNSDRVGVVSFRQGPLNPGSGVGKDLPSVGDYHIAGVVNTGGFMEHMVLQNTRLSVVYQMAEYIADEVAAALDRR